MQNNNISKLICKELSQKHGWIKESRRNVVDVEGEKWSFSVSASNQVAECRQVYADTVGFITKLPSNKILKFAVKCHDAYPVSRISTNGIKAHSIIIHDLDKLTAV
jgi:hypothetical protein